MNFMQSLGIKNNILVNKKSMNKFIKGKNIVLVPTFWDHCQISLCYFNLHSIWSLIFSIYYHSGSKFGFVLVTELIYESFEVGD